jgi:hypothetical protein
MPARAAHPATAICKGGSLASVPRDYSNSKGSLSTILNRCANDTFWPHCRPTTCRDDRFRCKLQFKKTHSLQEIVGFLRAYRRTVADCLHHQATAHGLLSRVMCLSYKFKVHANSADK